jgi:hypothetical protein
MTLVLFAHCDTKSLPSTHGELKLIVVFKLSVPIVTLHNPNLLPKGFDIVQKQGKLAMTCLYQPRLHLQGS